MEGKVRMKIANIIISSTNRRADQIEASVRVTLEGTQDLIDLYIHLPQDPNLTIEKRDDQILDRARYLLSAVE